MPSPRRLLLLLALPAVATCGDGATAPTLEEMRGEWELRTAILPSCAGFAERRVITFTLLGTPDANGRLAFSSLWSDGTPLVTIPVATGVFDARARIAEVRFEIVPTLNAALFRGTIKDDGTILGTLSNPAEDGTPGLYAGTCEVRASGRRTGPAVEALD